MKYTAITYVHSHKIDYEIRTIVINNKQHQLHCEKKNNNGQGYRVHVISFCVRSLV